jgi:DNA-binding SARP family transcriptional activator
MLAVLLAEAGRVVSTERLADEIWGERRPKAARHTVQNYVLRLRALLGADRLVTGDRGYALAVGAGDLDLTEFERLVRDGHRALRDGDPDAAVAQLSEGLALWQGAAFADVPATSTLSAETIRLEQARLGALEDRLAGQLDLGRHAAVVDELYRSRDLQEADREADQDRVRLRVRPADRPELLRDDRGGRQRPDRNAGRLEPGRLGAQDRGREARLRPVGREPVPDHHQMQPGELGPR